MNLFTGLTAELDIVLSKSTRSDLLWGLVISTNHWAFQRKVGERDGFIQFPHLKVLADLDVRKKKRTQKSLEILGNSYITQGGCSSSQPYASLSKATAAQIFVLQKKAVMLNPTSSCCLWQIPDWGIKSFWHSCRASPALSLVPGQ